MVEKAGYKPLSAIKGVVGQQLESNFAEWNGQKSARTFHVFINETSEPVQLYWFYDSTEQFQGSITPGSNLYVGTYTFNQWKVKSSTGRLLGLHCGQSATVTVRPSGCAITFNSATVDADDRHVTSMQTAKGTYAVRMHALGMPVWAFDCVEQRAVQRAAHILSCMLEGAPPSVLQAILAHKPALAVFGRNHVVSDVPPHSFMRHNTDRALDTTARGLGGTPAVPVTSCAEENLVMEGDRLYPCQSIFVHEMGHAVQNLGFDAQLSSQVTAAYQRAVADRLYPDGCYMVCNECEYWATGTEAWFESTIRQDVNGGVNTRDSVKRHDPRLAAVLAQVYGDGAWRYHHDSPHPLSFYPTPYQPPVESTVSSDQGTSVASTVTPLPSAAAGQGTSMASAAVPHIVQQPTQGAAAAAAAAIG